MLNCTQDKYTKLKIKNQISCQTVFKLNLHNIPPFIGAGLVRSVNKQHSIWILWASDDPFWNRLVAYCQRTGNRFCLRLRYLINFNTLFKPLFHPFLDFSCDLPFSCWSALLVWIKIRGRIVNSFYWVNFMYWAERSAKYLYTHAKREKWCIPLSNPTGPNTEDTLCN